MAGLLMAAILLSRVELLMRSLQIRNRQPQVPFRGRKASMPKNLLHMAQIRLILQ